MTKKKELNTRRVYLAFEFEKDAERRTAFISQAQSYCDFLLEDLSIPQEIHDERWQKEAQKRIKKSDLAIVLLGIDSHNAPGVKDEVSLAKQEKCPIFQLLPQHKEYGSVGRKIPIIQYKWTRINEMLKNPREYLTKK